MVRRLSRSWRVAGTGISFAVFGAAGVVLGLCVFPLLQWTARDARRGEFRVQRIMHLGFRAFVRLMEVLGLVEVTVRDEERLHGPGARLIVSNHPTLIDVVLLGSRLPQLDCVVKKEAWSNPFMRGVFSPAGYIPNDLGDAMLDTCAGRLQQGRALLLFPEGTRSPKGELGRFRRGAAHVALRSRQPLIPVSIRCEPPSLMRGQQWYQVPESKMQFTIEVGEPIDPQRFTEHGEARGVGARSLTAALRDFYEKRLQTPSN